MCLEEPFLQMWSHIMFLFVLLCRKTRSHLVFTKWMNTVILTISMYLSNSATLVVVHDTPEDVSTDHPYIGFRDELQFLTDCD